MKELIAAAGKAKVVVDAGFSRVGRLLGSPKPADRAAMILAARAVSATNALAALCERGHANESLPLLRAVAEWSLALRWLTEEDADARASSVLQELDRSWETVWDAGLAGGRARSFGVPEGVIATALESAPQFSRGNAQGLPWGHAAAPSCLPAKSAEEILSACVLFLGHALAGLDKRWPGQFPGAEEMWKGVKK